MDAARQLTAGGVIRGTERIDKLGLGGGRGRGPSTVVLQGFVGPSVTMVKVGSGQGVPLCTKLVREVSNCICILSNGWDTPSALRFKD